MPRLLGRTNITDDVLHVMTVTLDRLEHFWSLRSGHKSGRCLIAALMLRDSAAAGRVLVLHLAI